MAIKAENLPDNQNTTTMSDEILQHRELFRCAPIGIVHTTVDGKILLGNQAFAEMLGYKNFEEFAAIAGNKIIDIYEDPYRRKRLFDHHRQNTTPFHFENRWKKKDGDYCFCRLHVRAFNDSNGKFQFFEGFIEDISHQKKIEKELKESAEYYRSVFENTGTATIIIENDTTVSLANERFSALTGYSKKDIEGKMRWPVLIV